MLPKKGIKEVLVEGPGDRAGGDRSPGAPRSSTDLSPHASPFIPGVLWMRSDGLHHSMHRQPPPSGGRDSTSSSDTAQSATLKKLSKAAPRPPPPRVFSIWGYNTVCIKVKEGRTEPSPEEILMPVAVCGNHTVGDVLRVLGATDLFFNNVAMPHELTFFGIAPTWFCQQPAYRRWAIAQTQPP